MEKGFEADVVLDSIPSKGDSIALEQARKALKQNQKYTRFSDEEMERLDSIIVSKPGSSPLSLGLKQEELDSLIANGAPQQEKLKAMGLAEDAGVFTKKLYIQLLKLYEQRAGGILQTLYDTIPVAMFIMLPLFAILLKLFYLPK